MRRRVRDHRRRGRRSGRRSGRDRRRGRRMADCVADNAVQVAAVIIVRVGRVRRRPNVGNEEPSRRGKRSATARTTLFLRREPRVVVCAALVGVLVVPRVVAVPARVTRRRVVDAPEAPSRRRSSGRGHSRDVSAGARPGSDLGKPRDVPARAAGPDHGDARARGVGRAELPLAAAVGAATGPVASTPSTPSTRRLLDGVTMPALTARRRCTRRTA